MKFPSKIIRVGVSRVVPGKWVRKVPAAIQAIWGVILVASISGCALQDDTDALYDILDALIDTDTDTDTETDT